MKKGFWGTVLAVALLTLGVLAIRCGGGIRDELAQLDLRIVLGLQGDEIRFLYHNERLDAYEMLIEAASAQADETELGAVEVSLSKDKDLRGKDEVHVLLASYDETRANGKDEPLIYAYLKGDRKSVDISQALNSDDLYLIDPVAFIDGKDGDIVESDTSSSYMLYLDGNWKNTRCDDLQDRSEIEVLLWLEPWLVAVARKLDGPALETIDVIRAEGLPVFVAMGPSPGELHLNPILLRLVAAVKYDISKVGDQPAVISTAPEHSSGLNKLSDDTEGDEPRDDVVEVPSPNKTGTTRETIPGTANTGDLGEIKQAQTTASTVTGCSCSLCADEPEDICVCLCDTDAEEEQDSCAYGCADDPTTCATVAAPLDSWRLARRVYLNVFHWGALFVPGIILWVWRRRLRLRELKEE